LDGRIMVEHALGTLAAKPILTQILFRDIMVSSFLLLTLSGRRYRPASR